MKTFAATVLAAFIVGCSPPQSQRDNQAMDRIEASVQLPEEAYELQRYARIYTLDPDGLIEAYYFMPTEPIVGESCEKMVANFDTVEVPCPDFSNVTDTLKAGQRLWIGYDQMPGFADGGCQIVHVLFDPVHAVFKEVACNGVHISRL